MQSVSQGFFVDIIKSVFILLSMWPLCDSFDKFVARVIAGNNNKSALLFMSDVYQGQVRGWASGGPMVWVSVKVSYHK